jgi:multidrug efflux pump subunit AcrA (membrane-fusion protein)
MYRISDQYNPNIQLAIALWEKNMRSEHPRKRSNKRSIVIISSLIVLVAAAIGVTYYYSRPVEASEPALQTARVRSGDLVISISGAGSLLPATQAELGFRSPGLVAQVLVKSGQSVAQGELLAQLDDTSQQLAFTQAQANLDALFTPASLAIYQAEVASAQIASDDALLKLEALESIEEGEEPPAETDLVLARARLAQAGLALGDAASALEIIESGPDALVSSLVAADGTALARLRQIYLAFENTRLALENTRLSAPFAGTVVSLKLTPGQSVNTSPVITLADLDELQVKFYIDETDLSGVAVGNPVLYTFDAYPDTPLQGEVTSIESALQTIDGSPLVVLWGSLDAQTELTLLSGMSAEIEIITGEAREALLLPIQALREITPGSFAVFLVGTDGSLKLTPVTVGLRDFASAQILSGVAAGDVVSTGTVETK